MSRTIVGLTIAVMIASGCESDTLQVENDINVILMLPLTGSFQARGELHKSAIQMAFADLTEQGDLIDGRPLRVWLVDSTSDPAEADRRLRTFIDQQLTSEDGNTRYVNAIISSSEPAQIGSLPVALELEIPHFEISSGSRWDLFVDAADTRAHELAFMAQAVSNQEALFVADYINTVDVWEKLIIMRGTGTADALHTNLLRARLAQIGWSGTILNAQDIIMEYDGEPWRSHLSSVDSQPVKADVIYFKLTGDRHVRDYLGDAKLVDVFSNLVSSGTTIDEELLDSVNPGIIDFLDLNYSFAVRSPVSESLGNDNLERFKQDFAEFTGAEDYELWAPSAYDAAMVLGLGIIAAGTTDGYQIADAIEQISRGGSPINYGDTATAVQSARVGSDLDYQGASGSFDIRDDSIEGSSRDTARAVPGEVRINQATYNDGDAKGSFVTVPMPAPQIL